MAVVPGTSTPTVFLPASSQFVSFNFISPGQVYISVLLLSVLAYQFMLEWPKLGGEDITFKYKFYVYCVCVRARVCIYIDLFQ